MYRVQLIPIFPVSPPPEYAEIEFAELPALALGGFLAVLGIGAVGHALVSATRRRRGELGALGMTGWHCRGCVVAQASVIAVIGLLFGIPLGLALGRAAWRWIADSTPVLYVPPVAFWALVLVAPIALLAAGLFAAWLRISEILRAE